MQNNNATFIIRTGLTKKVGLPNFGSFGAECSVELVTDIGLLSSPEKLDEVRNQMYSLCLDSVESQINLQLSKHVKPGSPQANTKEPETAIAPPQVPPKTSDCGAWFKSHSDKYAIPLHHLVNGVYGVLIPAGTCTDWKQQGLALSARWVACGNTALQVFEEALKSVFDNLDKQPQS